MDFKRATWSLRRLRQNGQVRQLVRECRVSLDQMIQPLFIAEGLKNPEPIPGLTGTYRDTSESIFKTIESDLESGVKKFLVFGVPQEKRSGDFKSEFTVNQIQAVRKRFGKDVLIFADVCLCSSTQNGHCGVMTAEGDHVDNQATVRELSQLALAYAQAGVDGVAPSDMMDGRVGSIRATLDEAGLERTLIMSYSAKFRSQFYGPFRVAADCSPKGGHGLSDRSTYQIDPASPTDAYLSSLRDAEEGADILMVKPGMPYLDQLYKLSREIEKPWAVYQVSGEYAAIELLSQNGLMTAPEAHVEAWTAFVRAGASIIITYGARYARQYLERSSL